MNYPGPYDSTVRRMSLELPIALDRILADTPELRRCYLVGGCVRDSVLGIPSKDFDIECFGLTYQELVVALRRWGKTALVGRAFGVVKLTTQSGESFDFSIPRRDSKPVDHPRELLDLVDTDITEQEAAQRRDFTINALMYDPRARKLLDFVGGLKDLNDGILRHTSSAFVEDPLRVLRGMQCAARFNLVPASETVRLCQRIKARFAELPPERVWNEWYKWAWKSTTPSAGLKFLVATEWVEHFPEIMALQDVPQDPQWHPEGDVFIHTCHSCDAMSALADWQRADCDAKAVYMLAALAHDFGKPATTRESIKGSRTHTVSPGHDEAGGPVAEAFLQRIGTPRALQRRVIPLVKNHLAYLQPVTDRSVRRLAKRLVPESIHGLSLVMTADLRGRPPSPSDVPDTVLALRERAKALKVQNMAPKPILMGRHLMALGLVPGPEFEPILEQAYNAQLEGSFSTLEEALSWLKEEPFEDLPEHTRLVLGKADVNSRSK